MLSCTCLSVIEIPRLLLRPLLEDRSLHEVVHGLVLDLLVLARVGRGERLLLGLVGGPELGDQRVDLILRDLDAGGHRYVARRHGPAAGRGSRARPAQGDVVVPLPLFELGRRAAGCEEQDERYQDDEQPRAQWTTVALPKTPDALAKKKPGKSSSKSVSSQPAGLQQVCQRGNTSCLILMPGFDRLRHRPTPFRARIGNRLAAVARAALAGITLAACGSDRERRRALGTGRSRTATSPRRVRSPRAGSTGGTSPSCTSRGASASRRHPASPATSPPHPWSPTVSSISRTCRARSSPWTSTPAACCGAIDSSTARAPGRTGSRSRAIGSTARAPRTPSRSRPRQGGCSGAAAVTLGDPVIDVAPQLYDGLVFTSTIGLPPGGKGILYALDANTGRSYGSSRRSRVTGPSPERPAGGRLVSAERREQRGLLGHGEPLSLRRHEHPSERRSL